MAETKYKYNGKGDAFIGVPARDLTDEDCTERAEQWAELGITEELLVNSGLYSPVGSETKKKSTTKTRTYNPEPSAKED